MVYVVFRFMFLVVSTSAMDCLESLQFLSICPTNLLDLQLTLAFS